MVRPVSFKGFQKGFHLGVSGASIIIRESDYCIKNHKSGHSNQLLFIRGPAFMISVTVKKYKAFSAWGSSIIVSAK